MLIEQTTTYAYKLKYLENPTFDKVRNLAKKFIDELPKELVDDLYNSINRGVDILKTEPEMLVYLYSFGNMHQAKLNKAFENIPEILFDQPEINIIDYGCGQAIGTMCYVDFIRQKGVSQKVKLVTLIEPSEICLKRAALHVSAFCPDAAIVTVNKPFDDLDAVDIVCDEEIPTLHILSNVLDLEFDLERFAELISDNLKGYNQFVCVGPYFGLSDKDKRMENLYLLLNGDENFCQFYDKYELNPNRSWTAQIRCFSNGELEEELSTKVTWDDIENGVKDEFGVVYSKDGKRLLKGNVELKSYIVKYGTKVICDEAFVNIWYGSGLPEPYFLQQINIPDSVKSIGEFAFYNCMYLQQIIIPNSVTSVGNSVFSYCNSLQQVILSDSVTSIDDETFSGCKSLQQVLIPSSVTSIGNSAFDGCESLQQMLIPSSVTSIGNSAFSGCESLQQVLIPSSVTSIGDSAFGGCKSLQQVHIPSSVTSIGNSAFCGCKSLQQVYIPSSVTSIGDTAFYGCNSLQQITIPNSVMSIGQATFHCCGSLLQITIPNSVTGIGSHAFYACSSLQQITISNSVTRIGMCAFDCCESLQQIIITEGSEEYFKKLLPDELWDKLYSKKNHRY